ncbi:hypothetical protein ACJX0J_028422, partial [Zea mays]
MFYIDGMYENAGKKSKMISKTLKFSFASRHWMALMNLPSNIATFLTSPLAAAFVVILFLLDLPEFWSFPEQINSSDFGLLYLYFTRRGISNPSGQHMD